MLIQCGFTLTVGSNPTRSAAHGTVAEWLKALDWKSGAGQPAGGSNPSRSAKQRRSTVKNFPRVQQIHPNKHVRVGSNPTPLAAWGVAQR